MFSNLAHLFHHNCSFTLWFCSSLIRELFNPEKGNFWFTSKGPLWAMAVSLAVISLSVCTDSPYRNHLDFLYILICYENAPSKTNMFQFSKLSRLHWFSTVWWMHFMLFYNLVKIIVYKFRAEFMNFLYVVFYVFRKIHSLTKSSAQGSCLNKMTTDVSSG